jgi:antitoxin component YwqK of YwqJK toxin-antitoxin module
MNKLLPLMICFLLLSCQSKLSESSILAIQLTDLNGFTETITNPKQLISFEKNDFLTPQPYKKIVVTYRPSSNTSSKYSKVLSYHQNGQVKQLLNVEGFQSKGLYKEWYSNGQLRVQTQLVGGTGDLTPEAQKTWVFNDLFEAFYSNQEKKALIPFIKGKLSGEARYFFPNGQTHKIIEYSNNEINGSFTSYNTDGTLSEETRYSKGLKHGPATLFNQDVNFRLEEFYEQGYLLSGTYFQGEEKLSEVFNRQGKRTLLSKLLKIEEPVIDGQRNGLVKEHSSTGFLKKEKNLKGSVKDGLETFYFSTPPYHKRLSISWELSQLNGPVNTWYSNGNTESSFYLKQGTKEGLSKAWFPSGHLMFHEEYYEGKLINASYYKEGEKKPFSLIKEGKGLASLFDEQGFSKEQVHYENGEPQ